PPRTRPSFPTRRSSDLDIAAGRRDDRGIDADKSAVRCHQRAARIAGIDRGVGLDEVLIAFDVQSAAAQRAYDAGGDGLAEPERIDRKSTRLNSSHVKIS